MKPPKPPKHNPYQQSLERNLEKPKASSENKVEQAVVNFTRLPETLIEAVLSMLVTGELSQPKNHTDLNDPDVKKRMEEGIDQQDNKHTSLAELRRQLSTMRNEETQAKNYFAKKEQDREQADQQAEQEKAQKEKQAREQQTIQPSTKQKRGVMGQKRKKTAETSAAFGKQ